MDLVEVRDFTIFGGKKSRLEVISVLDKSAESVDNAVDAAALPRSHASCASAGAGDSSGAASESLGRIPKVADAFPAPALPLEVKPEAKPEVKPEAKPVKEALPAVENKLKRRRG